jgi:5-methylthioadenosine/S-adenosylhomocysteine deaminase
VSDVSTGRTLFRGGTVLTLDPRLGDFPKGDVLVEGARIAAVGPALKVDNAEIIDARDAIVLPGLVDAHRHAWQGALRRLMPNVDTPSTLMSMQPTTRSARPIAPRTCISATC